jgi:hypothetical protein
MLICPVSNADIVALLEAKPKAVLMQSASIGAPPLLAAIGRARKQGVEFKVLLGPKPDYEIVDNQIRIGSRPYVFDAGGELDALAASKVSVYINPKFNALRGTTVVPGAASHASYLVTNTGVSLVCTGTWNAAGFRQKNLCVRSEDRARALALTTLHSADFDYERPAAERSRRERSARQALVICPDCVSALRELLTCARTLLIRTAGLGDATELTALLRSKASSTRFLFPAAYRGQNPLIDALTQLGAQVRYVDHDFDGLTIVTRGANDEIRGLIGSLRLTQSSLRQSREVGARLDGVDATSLAELLDQEWNRGQK